MGFREPKLDNARKLRGVYFIDPDDKEVQGSHHKRKEKLEIPMKAALPCELQTMKRPLKQ